MEQKLRPLIGELPQQLARSPDWSTRDYRNPRNYVLPFIHNDDSGAAILIVVERQFLGNDLGVGRRIRGVGEQHSLVVLERQVAAHDVKEASHQPTRPPIQIRHIIPP